jgi:hypothetical protein
MATNYDYDLKGGGGRHAENVGQVSECRIEPGSSPVGKKKGQRSIIELHWTVLV